MPAVLPLLVALLVAGCVANPTGPGGDDTGGGDDVAEPCEVREMTGGVSTLAGCDLAGDADGDREGARFSNPVDVEPGAGDELYVADFDNHMIRTVDADGNVGTLVLQAGFQLPYALERVGTTLYVATDDNDRGEHSATTGTIWVVDTGSGEATVVVADIGRPRGLLALPDGRLVLSDYQHDTMRLLDPADGTLTDLVAATAGLSTPFGMALAPDGRILVADFGNNLIRAVTLEGELTTFAGSGIAGDVDGALADASFNGPQDLAVVGDDVYVADTDNHTIRRIRDGEVTTIAGTGEAGHLDHAELRAAKFFGLEGLAAVEGRLWVADGTRGEDVPYHRVRVVELD
jgi:DNA-binding beta-propeller fold protein YncE